MTQVEVTQKAQNLLACIQHGLQLHDEQNTAKHLGNRSQYIGLSDIGRALECPRAALCNKVFQRPQPSLQKLLTQQRGHWLEHGIGQAITAQGIHALPQLELAFTHNNVPIKAHFDFVLAWKNPHPAIRILELKSTANLPETLYTSYEMQLYGQASLIAQLWDKPAFSLRDEHGVIMHHNCTMPEICKAQFGMALPTNVNDVDIEAWVLCISMDDAKPFGPYTPHDTMRDLCLKTAGELWENKTAFEQGQLDVNAVAYTIGFHPLCAYCDWNSDCPKFHNGLFRPEWETYIVKINNLKTERNALDLKISTAEQGLKDLYGFTGLQGDWISTGNYRFKVSTQKGRRTLNKDIVRHALEEAQANSITNIDAALAACEQEDKSFQKLTISKIN